MKPMFTVHVGEYLVGEHIGHVYPRWNVWIPSKDTGIDLLVSDGKNHKTVSLQVKFSKDFNLSRLLQSHFLATGWWTHDPKKIEKSRADFWVFVIPSFIENQTNFIILPPAELLRRLIAIHGGSHTRIHSYLEVTKNQQCWETRNLTKADRERIASGGYSEADRDFTVFLNAWTQIEKGLD